MADQPTHRTPCPFCGAGVRLPPLPPGSSFNCPKCGKTFSIPGGPEVAVEPAKPAAVTPPQRPAAPPALPSRPTTAAPKPPTVPSPYAQPKPDIVVTNPLTAHRDLPPEPPPKPAAPKPKLIPLNCKLCGTLMYAGMEQLGKSVRCPDCHSSVLVEFQGNKKAVNPDAPANASYAPQPVPAATTAAEDPSGDDDDEFKLSPEPPPPPPAQHSDLASALKAGGHGFDVGPDGKIILHDAPEIESAESRRRRGYNASVPEKENQESAEWDRSEAEVKLFVQGTVAFLLRPEALVRALAYAAGAAILSVMLHAAVMMLFVSSNPISQFGGLAFLVGGVIAALLFFVPLSVCYLRIVQGTANGQDQIDWPDAMFLDWLGEAVFFAAALGVAAAPGILGAVVLSGMVISGYFIPVPILVSEMIFLPIVLLSMIEGGSMASVFSPRVAGALMRGADGMLIFAIQSFLIMAGVLLGVIAQFGFDPIFPPLGAALIVILGFIYSRLLGRLVWYCDVKPQSPAKESAEETPLTPPPDSMAKV